MIEKRMQPADALAVKENHRPEVERLMHQIEWWKEGEEERARWKEQKHTRPLQEIDFLHAVVNLSLSLTDMVTVSNIYAKSELTQSELKLARERYKDFMKKHRPSTVTFGFCNCKDCKSMNWIAHAYKEDGEIRVSRQYFRYFLNRENRLGLGLFNLFYAVMHEYLHLLYPRASEKTVELRTNRYFRKAMHVATKDVLELLTAEMGQY
jgi:hypothetical protein